MSPSLIGKMLNLAKPQVIPHADKWNRGGGAMYGPGAQSRSTLLQQSAGTGTLYAIVQLISTGVSSPVWHLFRKNTNAQVRYSSGDSGVRSNEQRTEVQTHQALRLWSRPNDFMLGQHFREIGWQFMELVAEWYWVIDRGPSGKGVPIEMWPVRPDRMIPIPSREQFLAGWVYTGPNGEEVPLSTDEVIQLKYPDPTDIYRGLSPVQALLSDIDAAKYTAEWSRNFFLNSATPGGIVQFSKRLTDDEFDEFTSRWRESHQGVSRGHRVGILEQGAIWIPNTYSLREMQFTDLRSMSREIIREAYRIHSSMLGLSEDVNRANAQTAEEVHVAWHELPRLRRMRTVLNEEFLPMFGATDVEFDFEDPTPANPSEEAGILTQKANAAAALAKAGWDMDGVLEAVGLPPIKGTPPLPPPAPGQPPAQPGQEPNPTEPSTTQAIAMSRMIRDTFRPQWMNVAETADDDPEFARIAEMLRDELPQNSNGHVRSYRG